MTKRSRKKKRRNNPAARLTDDLIVEILSRLPVKSLCRFKLCLEKEKVLSSEWKAKRGKVFTFNMELSKDIQEFMSNLVNDAGSESRQPFSTYAAACIMKEAELIMEWLRQGYHVPYEECNTSNEIRQFALKLAMFEGNLNTHIAAVLLGITKEAGSLLKSASLGCLVATDISTRIREYGLSFLSHKFDELELGLDEDSTTEINQLTWGNTESVSFGKDEMQEQCVSKEIIDLEHRLVFFSLPSEEGGRPNVVDEEGGRLVVVEEGDRPDVVDEEGRP